MPIRFTDVYGNTPPTMAATSSAPDQTKQPSNVPQTTTQGFTFSNRSLAITWVVLVGIAVALRVGYEVM